MTHEAEIVKPNGNGTPTEIVPQVRLGSLAINPKDVIARGTEFADALAEIINKQHLYSNIQGKKYVTYEGWVTLGALLGVMPEEEYCRPLADGNGFEAKVRLIRTSDGMTCGAASAECTRDESKWKTRDSYAIRSMSITRATGKAFRLSFSWIVKLAGFEPTPSEEMTGDAGSREAAQEVAQAKIAAHKASKSQDTEKAAPEQSSAHSGPVLALFYTYPPEFNGHYALLTGPAELLEMWAPFLLDKCDAKKSPRTGMWKIPREKVGLLEAQVAKCGDHIKQLNSLEDKLAASISAEESKQKGRIDKTSATNTNTTSAEPSYADL